MSAYPRIGIAILAAGESTRMGKVKQLLPWKQTTLLGHAIEIAKLTEVESIAVVLGANFELISESIAALKITRLHNHFYAQGQGTSVAKAAEWARDQQLRGVLLMLADQPKLSPEILHQLLPSVAPGSANEARRLTAAHYAGSLGVPAFFGEAYFEELMALDGETGAKSLLRKYADSVTAVAVPEAELDLDTEAEYKLALRQT